MSQRTVEWKPNYSGDEQEDPMEREALLQQMGQPPVNAQEVAGGGQKDFGSYRAPAAGDLSDGTRENHSTQMGMLGSTASNAANGASIGSMVGPIGTLAGAGIGAGYGAIKGFIDGRRNDTKNDREDFATQMGVQGSTGLWDRLKTGATDEAAHELQDRALNRIGKHDETANAQWMADVQAALAAGRPAPPPPAAAPGSSSSSSATSVAPTASATPRTTPYTAVAGFDTDRMNDPTTNSGKYDYARWMQDNEGEYNADKVRRFLASDVGQNWETNDTTGTDADPWIRQKQAALTARDPGRETRWQDVIRDSGGENGMSFSNAETRPGEEGFEEKGQLPVSSANGGGGTDMASLVSSDPEFFKRLMAQAQGALSGPTSIDDNALRDLLA
jgi:hypothetical protein